MKTNVTIEDIESSISSEAYMKVGTKMTVCLLTLKNGHEVIGTSGVVDASVFDLEIGKKFARKAAIDQLWPLFGFALQVKLSERGE